MATFLPIAESPSGILQRKRLSGANSKNVGILIKDLTSDTYIAYGYCAAARSTEGKDEIPGA